MMALNATSRSTGRTKNQAFWLAVLFMAGPSRHHPAVAVDARPGRIEAQMRRALRHLGAFVDQQLDAAVAQTRIDDPVAPGIADLHDIAREAFVGEGDELRPHADLEP